ncbi:MAG: PBP1A family penicillin-binding protein [Vicinamibacterales bacterium]
MATRPPRRPATRRTKKTKPARRGRTRLRLTLAGSRGLWLRRGLLVAAALGVIGLVGLAYLWNSYARIIDARLGGAERPVPRVYGRPLTVEPGRALSPDQLVARLNDVRYTRRDKAEAPGEFSVGSDTVTLVTRPHGSEKARTVTVSFRGTRSPVVSRITEATRGLRSLTLEPPLLAALAPGEKRRSVPLARIPDHLIQAVLTIEDRRFYEHRGVDPIRAVGALVTNLRGDKPYLEGASTLTQQIVKNTFLTPEKSLRRKLQEQFMAVVLETRLSKDQILELYLNDVALGQRGPFEIHGVAEASRIFFGKDVSNLSLGEAATIAGVIQAPSRLSPFRNPERAQERRDLVLREMASEGHISVEDAEAAAAKPLVVSAQALDNEAPYFVDYLTQLVDDATDDALAKGRPIDVYTTLDLDLQRLAQDAVASGMAEVDRRLAARRRPPTAQPQAALVAVDPRTGEILAMVGGRSYTRSQYNRAVLARRQPGSVFKPFVYLAAFEEMAEQHRADITPASVVMDEPTVFIDGDKEYTPSNYQNEYDGPITLRRALALSRNVVAIKVAEVAGYDRVANFWRRVDPESDVKPYPSIALGVFEASPMEIATAYTLFANGGSERALRAVEKVVDGTREQAFQVPAPRTVARPDTTYLVTSMMRSVMNEGTGAGARANGFTADAAGKSGTTNDLRDAWFVGFTPDLLTVVWVGFDDNQPIGLGGSQAALPIWTAFMKSALAGRSQEGFDEPPGIQHALIDPTTGLLATPGCPTTLDEVFLEGTAPVFYCHLHGGRDPGVRGFFSRIGRALGRIIR